MRHPDVPENLRGTYLGLAQDPIVEHLPSLGVTAVELMPVHHFVDDEFLVEGGLSNYWGYNSIGYFAPHARYASRWRPRPAGDRVQADGQAFARGRASRSSSTSSTTTPPKAIIWGRRCRFAALATRPTTT